MKRTSNRSGAVLVLALVFTSVAAMILATSLQHALRVYRSTKIELRKPQVNLLIDAGIARAVSQLENDSNYPGETWDVSSAFDERTTSTIQITVNRIDAKKSAEITILARLSEPFPQNTPGIQQSHSFTWEPPSNSPLPLED